MARLSENALGAISVLDSQDRVVFSLGKYGGSFSGAAPSVVTAAPTGTSSTTMVAAGVGQSYTPGWTGKVKAEFTGNIANATTTDGSAVQIVYGQTSLGAAVANGVALPSNAVAVGSLLKPTFVTSVLIVPFHLQVIVQLVQGTPYWWDLQFESVTGGTTTLTSVTCSVSEVL
jgi:hypothetical protein